MRLGHSTPSLDGDNRVGGWLWVLDPTAGRCSQAEHLQALQCNKNSYRCRFGADRDTATIELIPAERKTKRWIDEARPKLSDHAWQRQQCSHLTKALHLTSIQSADIGLF